MEQNNTKMLTGSSLELTSARFSWVDYLVFSVMLAISAGIGVYYAIRDKKNSEQFLMAGKSMGTFPVVMSLIAR